MKVTVPLAPYGLRVIVISLLASLVLTGSLALAVGWYGLLGLLPAVFVAFFFRDPQRIPDDNSPKAVLAPADGRIVSISDRAMPKTGERAAVIDIFLSVFDVHINRAPQAGRVTSVEYSRGRFLNALRAAAAEANESNLIALEAGGANLAVRQIAGVIARRIVCAVKQGDNVAAGQRLGMIMFGSRTQVFVSAEAGFELEVRLGQHVKAGKTVLGHVK